jgi:CheY-like chemotaxis protein
MRNLRVLHRESRMQRPAITVLSFGDGLAEYLLMTNNARTALVIDDDVILADLLAVIVEGAACRAVVATDGAEGVALAQALFPDVVFCDMSMPGMTGAEVLRTIRNDPATAHARLVLVTGHEHPDLHAIGADAYLAKPFLPSTVLNLLQSLLQESEMAA